MVKYTISGDKEAIDNFMDNANWLGFFNKFHCVIERERIDDNTLIMSFGLPRHYLIDFRTEDEQALAEMLEKECKDFNVSMEEKKEC